MKLKKVLNKLKRKTRNVNSIREIDYDNLKNIIKSNPSITIIDVRSPQEYAESRISQSINIPEYEIEYKINKVISNKSAPIIIYCQSGRRSIKAYRILEKLGYTNLYNLKEGLNGI